MFVKEIVPGGAVALEGSIKVGDRLLAVDGQDVSVLETDEIAGLIRGAEGTKVSLTVLKLAGGADSKETSVQISNDIVTAEGELTSSQQSPASAVSTTVVLERRISPLRSNGSALSLRPSSGGDIWLGQGSFISIETFFPPTKPEPTAALSPSRRIDLLSRTPPSVSDFGRTPLLAENGRSPPPPPPADWQDLRAVQASSSM